MFPIPEEWSVKVDLSYTETGTGPPLVILHGLLGSKRNWATIAAKLGKSRRVIAADLRNHGESPWSPEHDYPSMAADVIELIERRIGGPTALMGHSMGGKVAMTAALARPDLVERLVVVDIAPARSTSTSIHLLRAMRAVPLVACERRRDVDASLAKLVPDLAVRAFLVQNLVEKPLELSWAVNLEALDRNFDAILDFPPHPGRSFDKPTLFLAGSRSDYIQPHHRAEIERLFPAATIEVVPDAGHWVHAEAPAAFLEAVSRFLGR